MTEQEHVDAQMAHYAAMAARVNTDPLGKDAMLAAAARMMAALVAANAAAAEMEALWHASVIEDAERLGQDWNPMAEAMAGIPADGDDPQAHQVAYDELSERFGYDKMYNAMLNDDLPSWLLENLAEGIETRQAALAALAEG